MSVSGPTGARQEHLVATVSFAGSARSLHSVTCDQPDVDPNDRSGNPGGAETLAIFRQLLQKDEGFIQWTAGQDQS